MQLTTILALSLPLAVLAAPRKETCTESPSASSTVSTSTSTSSAAPTTQPTAPYTVISARSGSPIHFLSLNAVGYAFYLGGSPSTDCPLTNQTLCPPGNVTAFIGLDSLDTEVPGGQYVYVAADGHLGFTIPHSGVVPSGAVSDALTYVKDAGEVFGDLSTNAFGATGFMACPTNGTYQVFAALQNATVPSGNVSDCLDFDALTSDYTGGVAAWEYD